MCAVLPTALLAETSSHDSFDFDWRFHLGDVQSGASVDLDESDWQKGNLPHDWSSEPPRSPEFASGTC
jgi:hypothetical protein